MTFRLLDEAYALAIEGVAAADVEDASRLGDHLASLAAASVIDVATSDGPLRAFVERASPEARHHGLEGLGRQIYQTEDQLSSELIGRLRALWESWQQLAIARDDVTELRAFGWWFSSRQFEDGWLLATLDRVLAATGGRVDWQHEVIDNLVALAATAWDEVAGCLARLVENNYWDMMGGRRQVRSLLVALMATPAALTARTIAARLVARGIKEFRDLV